MAETKHFCGRPAGGSIAAMRSRTFLLVSLIALVFASLLPAAEKPPLFALHEVGKGVWAAISPNGSKAGANAGFVIGDNGVAVIDSFQNVDAARELLAEIRQKTSLPIHYLVNTHYHLDHMTGNGVFAEAGALILANENVRAWAHTENLKFFGPHPTAADRARVDAIALPGVTYNNGIDIYLGNRQIIVRQMPGHTGSDSIVVVPDANVVFTGDLFWDAHLPNVIDASTKPWIETLNALAAKYPAATFVPGHGEVGHLKDLEAFRAYLLFLREHVAAGLKEGKSGDALVAALQPEFQREYGSWGFFKFFLKPNILLTAAELQGKKRLPGGKVD
ncbi:MAG: MBL fold metallo-hydrolase [Acidobacteriota bacterium]|nr:MBL fold metallo-hydrolase [Acidobacteriota bacterium]